jgi:hypothetical protein
VTPSRCSICQERHAGSVQQRVQPTGSRWAHGCVVVLAGVGRLVGGVSFASAFRARYNWLREPV